MGTAHEWYLVLVVGFFFGGFLGLLNYPSRSKFVQPPRIYWALYVLDYALLGLWFGVMQAFNGRAFHPPLVYLLVYLNVGIIVCMLLLILPIRHFNRTLPRLPKKPAPFPVPDFLSNRKES